MLVVDMLEHSTRVPPLTPQAALSVKSRNLLNDVGNVFLTLYDFDFIDTMTALLRTNHAGNHLVLTKVILTFIGFYSNHQTWL